MVFFIFSYIHASSYPCLCPQRVEMASEFAVSEVFSQRKHQSEINRAAVPLLSSEQLRDHDDAYSEGRSSYRDRFQET